MPTLPWKTVQQPQTSATYTVMVTYLPLRHYRDTMRFIKYVLKVMNQLKKTDGLVGYSLRAHPLRKNYWTVSVWQNDEAIQAYIAAMPHAEIMKKMQGAMGRTNFTSWKIEASELPLRWEQALQQLTPQVSAD